MLKLPRTALHLNGEEIDPDSDGSIYVGKTLTDPASTDLGF
jgi:hypothetical protein